MTNAAPTATGPNPLSLPIYLAWFVALASTLGSLFLGEVMGLAPCALCWYQRICMYPLVPILTMGIVRRDADVVAYVLPLVIAGCIFAVYHNLLYYGVMAETLSPCTAGVPCTARQIDWFGFIGIPTLGIGSFAALLGLCIAHMRRT